MAAALPDLLLLTLFVVCYGLVMAGRQFVEFLRWFVNATVGNIPILSWLVGGVADRALQSLSSYLGGVANTYEQLIGWSFHQLAAEVEWYGRELAGLGLLVDAEAEKLADSWLMY